MSKIETIINELVEIQKNPTKVVEDHKKATGKGAIGIMPIYAPEELVHATGFLPVGIWGGQKNITKARAYLPPFACSIMQSVMEYQLEGAYDNLDAVLISVPCDTLKCISQKWKGTSKTIVFTHPQNRKIEAANTFLVEEYKIIRTKLEEITGVKITDEALNKSIDIYNENRQIMRVFSTVAERYPHIIDPATRHAVIKSRFFMEKAAHTAKVRELIAAINEEPIKPWEGKKIILTGILAEPAELLDIFKEFDLAVVADDLAQESRQWRVLAPETGEPLYRLAKMWQDLDGCSVAGDNDKLRGGILIDMVKKHKADAVIVCMMKFCDPEEFDYPVYFREFEENGIKNIQIEVDQQSNSFEQLRTRIQSFVEMMNF